MLIHFISTFEQTTPADKKKNCKIIYYFWMQCGCGGISHVQETFSSSEFNVSPISSVSLPNLQVIFGSVDSSVLRNFDATMSLDSAEIEKKKKRLDTKWINDDNILTTAPGDWTAGWILVVNGNASAWNAVAIMELNVAIDFAAMCIIDNSSIIETCIAYARMTFMTIWINYLPFHILSTIEVAFSLRNFVNFLFIYVPITKWKWEVFFKFFKNKNISNIRWLEFYRIRIWRSIVPPLLDVRNVAACDWINRDIRYVRNWNQWCRQRWGNDMLQSIWVVHPVVPHHQHCTIYLYYGIYHHLEFPDSQRYKPYKFICF